MNVDIFFSWGYWFDIPCLGGNLDKISSLLGKTFILVVRYTNVNNTANPTISSSGTFERQSLSTEVVGAVADAEDEPATALTPPLASVIDPDALDSLFQVGSHGQVEFSYLGYQITVDSAGNVTLDE